MGARVALLPQQKPFARQSDDSGADSLGSRASLTINTLPTYLCGAPIDGARARARAKERERANDAHGLAAS